MLLHTDMKCVKVLQYRCGTERIQYGTQQHRCSVVYVNHCVDYLLRSTDCSGYAVVFAVHELRHGVDNHVGSQFVRGEYH